MVGGQLKHTKMADDCLVLLDYVSKHPDEYQTQESLSEVTGIPQQTISDILKDERETDCSMLSMIAYKYGFDYHVYPPRGRGGNGRMHRKHPRIIDAVYLGFR